MDAAEQIAANIELSEALPWVKICERHPDQFVCLVDVVKVEPHSPAIATARIVGYGQTRPEASAIIRNDLRYTAWTVVFTGKATKPLRRPPVYFEC
ncbi:MAG: hypothetical protein R3B48_15625 [Kofleriaceae bacterium]